jgi:uncharacterized protein with PIN domain
MTDINDDEIRCEYCDMGFTGHSDGVWRKIEDRSDGTLNKVWCCEPCYTDPDDGADGQIVYETK